MKTPRRHRPQKTLKGFLLILATAAFLMLSPIAARAHDTLESTDPADGSVVGTVPAKIGMNFHHTPIAVGSVIRVEDSTGTDQAEGPVSIIDNHVTKALKPGAPEGKYAITWRVASADGHPIEGTFTFTAGTTTGTASTTAGASPSAARAGTSPGLPTGLIVAGAVALLLIVAFAGLAVSVKRRLSRPAA